MLATKALKRYNWGEALLANHWEISKYIWNLCRWGNRWSIWCFILQSERKCRERILFWWNVRKVRIFNREVYQIKEKILNLTRKRPIEDQEFFDKVFSSNQKRVKKIIPFPSEEIAVKWLSILNINNSNYRQLNDRKSQKK